MDVIVTGSDKKELEHGIVDYLLTHDCDRIHVRSCFRGDRFPGIGHIFKRQTPYHGKYVDMLIQYPIWSPILWTVTGTLACAKKNHRI